MIFFFYKSDVRLKNAISWAHRSKQSTTERRKESSRRPYNPHIIFRRTKSLYKVVLQLQNRTHRTVARLSVADRAEFINLYGNVCIRRKF